MQTVSSELTIKELGQDSRRQEEEEGAASS